MPRPTNEHLYSEIKLLKNDVVHLRDGQAKIQEDLTMIKKTLLNPDNGTISRVNRNTDFRKTQFRKNTQKVLWSIWIALVGIIAKLAFWN